MDHRPFIFDWAPPPRPESNWRLMVLIFVSFVGHVAVFYLFQVAYPPTERWNPRTRGAMLLSSVDPISAQVLRELDDRTFHLHGAGASEIAAYSLTKMSPKFRPSFLGHEVALKPVSAPAPEDTLPMLFEPGRVEYPALALAARAPEVSLPELTGGARFVEFRAAMEGTAEIPVIEVLPELRMELAAAGSWQWLRLRIRVGADGVIRHLLTESVDEGTISPRALEKVRQGVRFPPGVEPGWGWLEVRR